MFRAYLFFALPYQPPPQSFIYRHLGQCRHCYRGHAKMPRSLSLAPQTYHTFFAGIEDTSCFILVTRHAPPPARFSEELYISTISAIFLIETRLDAAARRRAEMPSRALPPTMISRRPPTTMMTAHRSEKCAPPARSRQDCTPGQ